MNRESTLSRDIVEEDLMMKRMKFHSLTFMAEAFCYDNCSSLLHTKHSIFVFFYQNQFIVGAVNNANNAGDKYLNATVNVYHRFKGFVLDIGILGLFVIPISFLHLYTTFAEH